MRGGPLSRHPHAPHLLSSPISYPNRSPPTAGNRNSRAVISQSTGSSSWLGGWPGAPPAAWRGRRAPTGASSGAASTSSVLRACQINEKESARAQKACACMQAARRRPSGSTRHAWPKRLTSPRPWVPASSSGEACLLCLPNRDGERFRWCGYEAIEAALLLVGRRLPCGRQLAGAAAPGGGGALAL